MARSGQVISTFEMMRWGVSLVGRHFYPHRLSLLGASDNGLLCIIGYLLGLETQAGQGFKRHCFSIQMNVKNLQHRLLARQTGFAWSRQSGLMLRSHKRLFH